MTKYGILQAFVLAAVIFFIGSVVIFPMVFPSTETIEIKVSGMFIAFSAALSVIVCGLGLLLAHFRGCELHEILYKKEK